VYSSKWRYSNFYGNKDGEVMLVLCCAFTSTRGQVLSKSNKLSPKIRAILDFCPAHMLLDNFRLATIDDLKGLLDQTDYSRHSG